MGMDDTGGGRENEFMTMTTAMGINDDQNGVWDLQSLWLAQLAGHWWNPFQGVGVSGYWWSSTQSTTSSNAGQAAYSMGTMTLTPRVQAGFVASRKDGGRSVRCIAI